MVRRAVSATQRYFSSGEKAMPFGRTISVMTAVTVPDLASAARAARRLALLVTKMEARHSWSSATIARGRKIGSGVQPEKARDEDDYDDDADDVENVHSVLR